MASMFKKLAKMKDTIASEANKVQAKIVAEHKERFDPGERFGALWEPSESCDSCRGCALKFIVGKKKHHCRMCAGVFCDSCTQFEMELEGYSDPCRVCEGCLRGEGPSLLIKARMRALLDAQQGDGSFADDVQGSSSSSGGASSASMSGNSVSGGDMDNAGRKFAAKLFDGLGLQTGVQSMRAVALPLTRGSRYDRSSGKLVDSIASNRRQSTTAALVTTAPVSLSEEMLRANGGYFEVMNKSSEVVCVKVLLRGGNPKFEVSRPSYFALLPGDYLHTVFDARIVESLYVVLLHYNPRFPLLPPPAAKAKEAAAAAAAALAADMEAETAEAAANAAIPSAQNSRGGTPGSDRKVQRGQAPMAAASVDSKSAVSSGHPVPQGAPLMIFYDTRASSEAINQNSITPCARVNNFRKVEIFHVPCLQHNVLLKYKGDGVVVPRVGNSIGRIGLIPRLQGLRGGGSGSNLLDFSTNVSEISKVFSFSV